MRFDGMRFTAANGADRFGDLIVRSLTENGGDISVTGMRKLGFRSLNAAMATPEFRAAAPLPTRSEVVLDNAVVKVGLQRLTFVADLIAEGLVYSLPDPLSVPFLEWNSQNKVGAAQRSMSPSQRQEAKLPILLPGRVPVYITSDGFPLDIRLLKQSQRVGMPLDTSLIEQCTRAVNEGIEDAGINGATTLDGQDLYVAGYNCPGLLNAPNANTQSLTAADFAAATVNGTNVLAGVTAMVQKLQGDNKFGPYNLYVGTNVGIALDLDFKANGPLTIRQRLEQLQYGGRNLRVRVADFMPSNKIALVQMTSDVVDVIDGQRPTVVPFTSLDGFTIHNIVMAIMVPRFRADYNGNSGICVGTLS